MKIQVGGLSEGVHRYRFEAKASDLGLDNGFTGGITVEATLEKTGNQLYLNADIRTLAAFSCDRCVTPLEKVLTPSYRMYYLWDETAAARYDPSEVQVISAGLNVVDITEDVRQTILLSVPLKILCREDCKGLCPICGRNLNEGRCGCTNTMTDSRWEKLRELRGKGMQDSR